jgi:hypothetical protein
MPNNVDDALHGYPINSVTSMWRSLLAMKKLLIALLIIPTAVYAAQPFLIFASDAAYSDPATLPLVQRYLSAQDYLGYRAVTSTPQLRGFVSPAHQVEISASLAGLEENV